MPSCHPVSTLFSAAPVCSLNQAYRIECIPPDKDNPQGFIVVTTPSGNTRIESNQATNFTGINKVTTTTPKQSISVPATQPPVASTSAPVATSRPAAPGTDKAAPAPAPAPAPRAMPEFSYAVDYVNRIKKRFEDGHKTYNKFLNTLQQYQQERKTIQEVRTP
jgi:histone deacetylase complex regulatory component SIN3